jgi:hypothetical protein
MEDVYMYKKRIFILPLVIIVALIVLGFVSHKLYNTLKLNSVENFVLDGYGFLSDEAFRDDIKLEVLKVKFDKHGEPVYDFPGTFASIDDVIYDTGGFNKIFRVGMDPVYEYPVYIQGIFSYIWKNVFFEKTRYYVLINYNPLGSRIGDGLYLVYNKRGDMPLKKFVKKGDIKK